MINILETVTKYNDSWNLTFYYIAALALLIGIFWTYLQVFVKPLKKKQALQENVIYNHPEDVIEESDKVPLKKKNNNKNKYYYKNKNYNKNKNYYKK